MKLLFSKALFISEVKFIIIDIVDDGKWLKKVNTPKQSVKMRKCESIGS